jgi:hypothetical protein
MPAPRKALLSKKRKHASAEETAAALPKLKLIKTKYAARVLELSRSALKAMKEIADIEAAMDLEAAAEVDDDYIDYVPDFKLTFEAAYAQHAEDADDESPRVDDCINVFLAIEKDATAAFSSETAAAATVEAASSSESSESQGKD